MIVNCLKHWLRLDCDHLFFPVLDAAGIPVGQRCCLCSKFNSVETVNAAWSKDMNVANFNKLSPAETEALAILLEECSEIVQVCGKILRHGLDSDNNGGLEMTNREHLCKEIADVEIAVMILVKHGFLRRERIEELTMAKVKKFRGQPNCLHHLRPL